MAESSSSISGVISMSSMTFLLLVVNHGLLSQAASLTVILSLLDTLESSKHCFVVGLKTRKSFRMVVDLGVHGLDGLVRIPAHLIQTIQFVEHPLFVTGLVFRASEDPDGNGRERNEQSEEADEFRPPKSIKLRQYDHPLSNESFNFIGDYLDCSLP